MTFEAFRSLPAPLPNPMLPVLHGMREFLGVGTDATSFGEDLLRADPDEVSFDLDSATVRITGERSDPSNTHFSSSGTLHVSAPGAGSVEVPVRFDVTVRNQNATPEQMRRINPFDPASIPDRTRIEVHGADYAGTPLEASFRALADANELASIDALRLSLEMTADGELRVMTGSEHLFDAPRDGGPASYPADRQDFVRHTTLLQDPRGADRAAYNAMLLDGTLPASTVRIAEDVTGSEIEGDVTETGSGETNEVTWTIDASGRPTAAEAVLTWEPGSGGRDSDRIEGNAQSRFRTDNDMAGSGDDVGHVIAYRFVNGHGPVNMFPQFGLFNRGAYAQMEQEWSDWLGNGMEVRISVDLVPNDVQRPTGVHVDYAVIDPASGKMVYDPSLIAFCNAAGQDFAAIAESSMDAMIDKANA